MDWHDALCGHSLDAHVARFGQTSYATDRNAWRRSARAGLLAELRKHGRGPADLHGCVNFFAKVATSDDAPGSLVYVPDHASAGDWVTLRAELDVLIVLSTAPHPLDSRWAPAAVRVEVSAAPPAEADDPSWTFRAESQRALRPAGEVLA